MTLRQHLDVALTNVAGLGAVQLVVSLLPALEADPRLAIDRIFLPDRGPLADYRRSGPGPAPIATRRHLPNAMSRLLECTIGGGRFDSDAPLLVLGDVPLRSRARQILFVQTPHMLARLSTATGGGAMKYAIMRAVFRLNLPRVAAFIVQSGEMREALIAEYGIAPNRVHVVQQPPPEWLLTAAAPEAIRASTDDRLRLFYPAADYPHKNHDVLAKVDQGAWDALVERLVMTITPEKSPNRSLESLQCVGRLAPQAMLRAYRDSDALLFLSKAESYGFPLVEAMWLGLPVIAPDLDYARSLCGDAAIYFDPDDATSLVAAIALQRARIAGGMKPDWRARVARLPKNWPDVAAHVSAIIRDAATGAYSVPIVPSR